MQSALAGQHGASHCESVRGLLPGLTDSTRANKVMTLSYYTRPHIHRVTSKASPPLVSNMVLSGLCCDVSMHKVSSREDMIMPCKSQAASCWTVRCEWHPRRRATNDEAGWRGRVTDDSSISGTSRREPCPVALWFHESCADQVRSCVVDSSALVMYAL